MTKATERRNFWRAVFHSPVRLTTHDGNAFARLQDISLKGALLETGNAWHGKPGEECRLSLELAADATITMWTKVMHVEGRHVGLRCESIDLDSITHLRRLVELNSGDPAILDREFASLAGEG
ncbi:PilZ domain-containing protein [Sulfuritalea hydrogenivorans]|uniref:Cyclic diguanosine monophosphate-binding protein n=1 Tax=Sulfuritalea hydrogenivorans sk43H TaxID=1223802 RepID=W0SCD0_9PROT|nr:PilZ domain-containing protein [Sulfuritalea hydrogenivorans]MDK9716169.1 PilZ domain-containing protein [Sulfuritalea sp.]BAO28582.1 type IV pilus assembly PilZ [Sulfuritalea hydrogenivorans sk43H]